MHLFGTRSLFKCVLLVYMLSLIVIILILYPLNKKIMLQKSGRMQLVFNGTVENVRNVTVYINRAYAKLKYSRAPVYAPSEDGNEVNTETTKIYNKTLNHHAINRTLHGFDTFVSDTVSLHRKLPDIRPPACKKIVYPENLPQISVVIVFRDEWPSILLRTAYSVMENSPLELIKEVVLVDDGSLDEDLRKKVDRHVASDERFKLVRHEEALGLMLARQRGIEATTADYFAVLDGHMEVSPGWLEPLLYRLTQEPNVLLSSYVHAIDKDNLDLAIMKENVEHQTFDDQFPFFDPLTLDQTWAFYKDSFKVKRNNSIAPLEYGTIQGMMAVMRKDYFLRLGGFDPGMKIWGAEQIELSVKVWLCGGKVEMIPCSNVGHMYRRTPWGILKTTLDFYAANKHRMVEVWLDEPYKGFVLENIKHFNYQYGDLSDRHRIRKENKCKPYITFLEKVNEFGDVFQPTNVRQMGVIYNEWANKCLDLIFLEETDKFKLELFQCNGNPSQYFMLTENLQIRSSGSLLLNVAIENSSEIQVIKTTVNFNGDRSYWRYNPSRTVLHTATRSCLTIMAGLGLQLKACTGNAEQLWHWGLYKEEQ